VPVEDHSPRSRLDQSENRSASRSLTAAGLAYKAKRLSARDRKRDAVNGSHVTDSPGHNTFADRVVLDEVFDDEDVIHKKEVNGFSIFYLSFVICYFQTNDPMNRIGAK